MMIPWGVMMCPDPGKNKEIEKELHSLNRRAGYKPPRPAGQRRSKRFMKKLMLSEILSTTIFHHLKRAIPPIPVVEDAVKNFEETWIKHRRVMEKWLHRQGMGMPLLSPVYRLTGLVMASMVFPRDPLRLVAFMIYVGEKHIDRMAISNFLLQGRENRLIVSRILKEEGEALRELREFKSRYFGRGVNIESRIKHLERSLDREFGESSVGKPAEEVSGSRPEAENGDIPLAADDEVLLLAKP